MGNVKPKTVKTFRGAKYKGRIEKLARILIEEGFEYETLNIHVRTEFNLKCEEEIMCCEDVLLESIDKFSECKMLTDMATGKEYYYWTYRQMAEDANVNLASCSTANYNNYLLKGRFKVGTRQFKTNEIAKDKTDRFVGIGNLDNIADIEGFKKHKNDFMTRDIRVIDTHTDNEVILKGKEFCEAFDVKCNHVLSYIQRGCRLRKRYKLEFV